MGRKKGGENKVFSDKGTYTPPEEIEICERCPYPLPKCGANGCAHFKQEKAKILEARGDKRRLRRRREEVRNGAL